MRPRSSRRAARRLASAARRFLVPASLGLLAILGLNDTAYTFQGRAMTAVASPPSNEASATPRLGICDRTKQVRDALVARIRAARDCAQVTAAHLAGLRGQLRLDDRGISSLKAGDFAGLSKLTEIWLDNNQLTDLPSDLFDGLPALEILQLGGNQLGALQSDVFNSLPALWFLDLSNNRLTSLSAGAFNGLPALERLLLGGNRFSTLPVDVFDGLSALWFLDLEATQLSTLPAGVFDGLSALEELNLEANRLSALPAGVFDGLSSLTELTLMANQLSSLPEDVFDGLSSLKKLGLDQNRLNSLPADVFDGLSSLTELTLMGNRLTSLPEGVFDGLSSLYWISLPGNRLTNLPDGVFEGLSALGILEVQDNSVDPMVLTVSLERVGNDGFKATAPAGAAFTMTLPLNVENGSIDGGAATLTIPVGAVESGAVSVIRTPGGTAAVAADIGPSLPPPPPRHLGYTLARASGPPLEVLPELPPALSVADARATEGLDGALVFVVTLDRSPSGKVTVSYATSDGTASAGEDYEAASGTLSFAAGETEKTVGVAVLDDADDEGEETLAFALSDASGAMIADGEATGTVAPPPGICARTEAVRDAIVARIESARDCAQVTSAHLAGLERPLELGDRGITSLKAGDFAGLSKLTEIWLDNNQLTSLPSDLFAGLSALWFLDLSNNRLTSLSAGAFNGLPALERLVLGANPLSALPVDVFAGLSALWFLDLEDTQLSSLPADVFAGLSALEDLNLEANRLSALPAGVFGGLSSLTALYLKENQLSSLPAEVFDGLSSLTTLRLDQNQLSSLPAEVFDGLSSLEELFLHTNRLTSAGLPPDVFDGLSSLFRLNLRTNQLTTLPDGLFGGLSALTNLELYENAVDPMLVTVSLERVGNNGFKATAPAGAPFTMTLPVNVTNGSIDGGATTLTIPVGAVHSGAVTVTRTAGTTAAVTADIGAPLPAPPPRNLGYALARAPGMPLEVLPELVSAPRIDGVPQVGNVFEVSFAEPPSGALAYQWLRGSEVIAGATASTYVPTVADVGARISVRVGNGGDSMKSAATDPVWPTPANPPLADGEEELLSATVTLGSHPFPLGVAGYGRMLGESFGEMDVTSFGYRGATYAIDAFFVNSRGLFGLATGSRLPDASGLVAYWNEYRISGLEAYAGKRGTLLALVGRTPQPSTEYSRYANGVSDGIRVAVSLRRAAPADDATEPNTAAAGAPAISGTPRVGEELTASTSDISDADGLDDASFAYQWIRADTDIPGATGSTYTPVATDEGERLKVRVGFTDDAGNEESLTSAATDAVAEEPSLLTASFEDLPGEHDGARAFTFRIAFSEPLSWMNSRRLREHVVAVAGGRATKAGRVKRRRDLWKLTVEPDSLADVTVTLSSGAACGTPAAVCTSDGRALSNTVTATVAGPVAVSVADARAEEGTDETIDFAVSLSRASSGPVAVAYATADGSATAGADYTATNGTLTFTPGETAKTVSVPVLDDAHDEGEETLTLRLSNASRARIADGVATGTIKNSDHMQRAWLARFGRTVATHVTDAVGDRLRGTPGQGSHLTVGGYRLPVGQAAAAGPAAAGGAAPGAEADTDSSSLEALVTGLARVLGLGPGQAGGTGPDPWGDRPAVDPRLGQSRTLDLGSALNLRQVLLGSSFRLALGGDAVGARNLRLTAWGRVAGTTFDGQDGALSLNGDVLTGTVGVDGEWDRLLAGLAVAHSRGDGSYTDATPDMGARGRGDLEQTLTSVHPYLRYAVTDRLAVWGLLGFGTGQMEMEVDTGEIREADTDLLMGAFGGRGILLAAAESGGFQLATRTDAMLTRTSSDAVAGMAESDADAHRLRLVLEGSRGFTWAEGQRLTPTMEVGLRHDWGDAETGFGLELGGRVQYADPALGLTIDATVRGLLAHEDDDYKEWGASGTVRIAPGAGGQGLALTLSPAWGATASGVNGLWSRQTTAGLAPQGTRQTPAGRLTAEVGYGFAPFDTGLLTPYAGTVLSEGAARTYRVGTRLQLGGPGATGLTLNLEGTRQEPAGQQPPNQGLRVQATWGF